MSFVGSLLTLDCFPSLQGELPRCLLTGPDDDRDRSERCKHRTGDVVPPRTTLKSSQEAHFFFFFLSGNKIQ